MAKLSIAPEMRSSRAQLPAYQHRDTLLSTIRGHRVSLIRGATGCGKSTQLPRLLLEDAAARGAPCRVVVAQPRRLAATALAHRVSGELGDDDVGGLCGYARRAARAGAGPRLPRIRS